VALGDIMAMTGHANASTVLRYHRRAAARSTRGRDCWIFRTGGLRLLGA
jgi:hypothetical protein